MSNDQKFEDIVLLTECAKIMQTLAETRHAEASSIRIGKGLLDIAARMKAEIEEDIKNKKKPEIKEGVNPYQRKLISCGWGGTKEFTREEYISGAVRRESHEMMQDPKIYSEEYKQQLRDKAAKIWDETK